MATTNLAIMLSTSNNSIHVPIYPSPVQMRNISIMKTYPNGAAGSFENNQVEDRPGSGGPRGVIVSQENLRRQSSYKLGSPTQAQQPTGSPNLWVWPEPLVTLNIGDIMGCIMPLNLFFTGTSCYINWDVKPGLPEIPS